jgi:hypothetical protein
MAVLVEGISVIVRMARLKERYPGGWDQFVADCPNGTLCSDSEVARVGFMTPTDVESFIAKLGVVGLVFQEKGTAVDIAVVDQISGPATPCAWLEFGHVQLKGHRVGACRHVGSTENIIITPDGWRYENSLSASYAFVPLGAEDKSLRFLRHEEGMDVFLNLVTGREVYMGRTTQDHDAEPAGPRKAR